MDEITGAQLLQRLPLGAALEVIWLCKEAVPPLPLEIWMQILQHIQGDELTAKCLICAHPGLQLYLKVSHHARTVLLRCLWMRHRWLSTWETHCAMQRECAVWGVVHQELVSCHICTYHNAQKLVLHLPVKQQNREKCPQFKCLLRSDDEYSYVFFKWGKKEIRVKYLPGGWERAYIQTHRGPSFSRQLRYHGMKLQLLDLPLPEPQATQARELARVLLLIRPVLERYTHSRNRQTRLTEVGTILHTHLELGKLVDYTDLRTSLWLYGLHE